MATAREVDKKADRTRRHILETAARLFRYEGYYATTMREIGRAAQLEAASIYYHFQSKEQILDEVFETGLRRPYEEVKRILADADASAASFRETLGRLIRAHLEFLLTESDFTSANIRNYPMLPDERRSSHKPLRTAYAELWGQFLQRARENGELRSDIAVAPVRQFILSAMNWTVEWYDVKRYPVEMLSERMTKLVLDGMCTKSGSIAGVEVERPARDLAAPAEQGRAAQTRLQILKAAARLLRESGYKAATMRRIAVEAGMEAGSVYYHFKSKEEIVDVVLHIGLDELIEGVRLAIAQVPDRDYRTQLATAIATHLEYLFRTSEFTSANIRSYGMLPREMRQRHRQIRHEYAAVWDALLKEAQEAGVLRSDIRLTPLRQVMLGALNWTVEWFDPAKADRKGHYSLQEFSLMLISLLLDGVSVPVTSAGASKGLERSRAG